MNVCWIIEEDLFSGLREILVELVAVVLIENLQIVVVEDFICHLGHPDNLRKEQVVTRVFLELVPLLCQEQSCPLKLNVFEDHLDVHVVALLSCVSFALPPKQSCKLNSGDSWQDDAIGDEPDRSYHGKDLFKGRFFLPFLQPPFKQDHGIEPSCPCWYTHSTIDAKSCQALFCAWWY